MVRNDLRNVAIIAHVDHGKTTLVDAMLRQSGAFRDNQVVAERVMDSGDIERERGITILAKNCSCTYKGVKINIVDTPGHADFGGEVERVLKMVNGVLLLVDAAEGCMPQTRFVLQKALQQNLSLVVAINKIDRPDARIKEVIDEVLYLLMDLGATDEQLDCPMLFCCGRDGTASLDPDVPGTDLIPLFDTLLSTIKPPEGDPEAPFQMLVSSVDYNEFVGRIAIGRIERGTVKQNQEIAVCNYHAPDAAPKKAKATALYEFDGLAKVPVAEATAGNIIAMSGIGHGNRRNRELTGSGNELRGTGVNGQRRHLQAIGMLAAHIERLGADRACTAQDGNAETSIGAIRRLERHYSTPPIISNSCAVMQPKISESLRSSMPPWPGIRLPESLTPTPRLMRDSIRSPITPRMLSTPLNACLRLAMACCS